MAKIKNMGTATMRFGEGVIVTGSVGNDTKTLVVDGGAKVTNNFTVSGDGGFDNVYIDDELVVGTVYNSLRVTGSAFLTSSNDIYSGDGSGDYSVSLWFKSADDVDENRIIFTLANSNARSTVREKGDTLQFLASADDNSTCVSGFAYYPDQANNWNFLTFVQKQNGANLETTASLNGAITDADSVAGKTGIKNFGSNTVRKLQLAGFTSDSDTIGNEMFIRDFILWDGSLSAADITTLYNGGNPYNFRNFTTYDKLAWLKPDQINATSFNETSRITNFGSVGGDFEVVDYDSNKIVEVNTDAPFTDPVGASLTVATDVLVHGDTVISGSLYAKQRQALTHKYSKSDNSDEALIRFNAAGSNGTGGDHTNNRFLAPADGKLISVILRSTSTMGSTIVRLLSNTDGNANLETGSALDSVTVNVSSANTAFLFVFSDAASYNAGDILGISVNPTSAHGNVDLTSVWEFDWVS